MGIVVAERGRSKRASRAAEGVRRNVFGWLLWPWVPWQLRVQRTVYTQYVHLFTTQPQNHIHTPLMLDCPPSERALCTPMRKLRTLMRKCLLPQYPHNSTLRPASPRPLRRAIPRQSLACPDDATSSPSPWLNWHIYTVTYKAKIPKCHTHLGTLQNWNHPLSD